MIIIMIMATSDYTNYSIIIYYKLLSQFCDRAICREKLRPKSSSGYVVCRKRNAHHRLVLELFVTRDYIEPFLEGVWLSVSPTDDALIVALDFEGGARCYLSPIVSHDLSKENDRCTQFRAFSSRRYPSRSLQCGFIESCECTCLISDLNYIAESLPCVGSIQK